MILIGIAILLVSLAIIYWKSRKFECDLSPQNDRQIFSGKVEFPKGIKDSSQYLITALAKTYKISSDGNFCLYGYKNAPFIVSASSNNKEDFILMAVVIPGVTKNILINDSSTAVTLVFISPLFLTNSSSQAVKIVNNLESNPKIILLANKIRDEEILSANSIENGQIAEAYKNALSAALQASATSNRTSTSSPQTPESLPITTPSISAVDTTGWQVYTVKYVLPALKYSIKYPPNFTPKEKSGDKTFLDSTQSNGIIVREAFGEQFDTILQLIPHLPAYDLLNPQTKDFATKSGLIGKELIDNRGLWVILIGFPKEKNNNVIIFFPYPTDSNSAYDIGIGEAMAESLEASIVNQTR